MPTRIPTLRVAAGVALALGAMLSAQAQTVRAKPNPVPSAAARAAMSAPNPAGLRAPFPAGVTSGSGAAVSTDGVAASTAITTPNAVTAATLNPTLIDTDTSNVTGTDPAVGSTDGASGSTAANTTVLGGAPGYGVARGPSQSVAMGNSGIDDVTIARAFISADGNRDGELSRAEAARLRLSLLSFEEMDRNFDGVITRAEYEDGMR